MSKLTTYAALALAALALLAASPAQGSPSTTSPTTTKSSNIQQVHYYRAKIVWNRSATCKLLARLSAPCPRTEHAERRTKSVAYLQWINHRWRVQRLHARHLVHKVMSSPKAYSRYLVGRTWPGAAEWQATVNIVSLESSFNPCASFPSRYDCSYNGPNACGIPQRNPCPYEWRGKLWATRWAQARELVRYIKDRYGDPIHAWYVRSTSNSY